jgi:lipopolysaccharide transport system permease protein
MVRPLYRYRWLLYELVLRDLILRYRGSVLGFLWTLLNPLAFMLVYVLVFSIYLKINIPHYALFLMAGILPWQWFAGAVQTATSSIVDGRIYVGRAVFPASVLTLVPVLSNLVNLLISLPILVAIGAYFHVLPGLPILVLPVLLGVQLLLTAAVALLLATFNVFFRDLQQLVIVVLNLVFYVSPIFYPLSSVPEALRAAVFANPMVPIIIGYQDIFYYDRMPDGPLTLYALVAAYVLFLGARLAFNHFKDTFADYL